MLFLTYMALSAVWSDNSQLVFQTFIEALLVLTFCLAISISITRFSWFLNSIIILCIMAAAINCSYSIYLHYSLPHYQPLPEPRLYALGRLSNPVIGALSYGFAIILASYMLFFEEQKSRKVGYFATILLFIFAIALTGSRGVYLALAAGISTGVYLLTSGNRAKQIFGVLGRRRTQNILVFPNDFSRFFPLA